jgi:hypothetical protein
VLARAITHALVGLEPRRVEVEADVYENTLPSFVIVGLPDRACAEADCACLSVMLLRAKRRRAAARLDHAAALGG